MRGRRNVRLVFPPIVRPLLPVPFRDQNREVPGMDHARDENQRQRESASRQENPICWKNGW